MKPKQNNVQNTSPRLIIVKLLKTKNKEKISQAAREIKTFPTGEQ